MVTSSLPVTITIVKQPTYTVSCNLWTPYWFRCTSFDADRRIYWRLAYVWFPVFVLSSNKCALHEKATGTK